VYPTFVCTHARPGKEVCQGNKALEKTI
jgi:hypothetical protein